MKRFQLEQRGDGKWRRRR
ncbi:MAG: hypothetical protein EZS28_016833, partial [Streblomastix strix]